MDDAGRAGTPRTRANAMPIKSIDDDPEQARRFRELALPYLDDTYTLARYLLRNAGRRRRRGAGCLLRAEIF